MRKVFMSLTMFHKKEKSSSQNCVSAALKDAHEDEAQEYYSRPEIKIATQEDVDAAALHTASIIEHLTEEQVEAVNNGVVFLATYVDVTHKIFDQGKGEASSADGAERESLGIKFESVCPLEVGMAMLRFPLENIKSKKAFVQHNIWAMSQEKARRKYDTSEQAFSE